MESEGLSDRILQFLRENLIAVSLGCIGLIFSGYGLIAFLGATTAQGEIVIEEDVKREETHETIMVDISGAVNEPGVYEFSLESRLKDAVEEAGGLTADADHTYISKNINLAQRLTDGMKVYIPLISDDMQSSVLAENTGKTSINNASGKELEDLPGIGPVTAEKIITNRPYSSIDELISKKSIGASVFEKIKDKISL